MKKIVSVLMTAVLIAAMLFVPVFAADVPTEAEIREIFKDLGISTWGDGYFGCHMMNPSGDPAPDSVIHQYIQSANLLEGYEASWEETNEWGTYPQQGYELPYTKYIEIIDSAFANHSDMKSYLNNEWSNYYNEETGMVKWGTGGFGGPSDWVVDEISYSSGNYIYATGLFLEYAYEDDYFNGMAENYDYVVMSNGEKAKICDRIILTLSKEDGKWKILEYRENSYHISDDILYESFEKTEYNRLTIEKTGAAVNANDYSKDFPTGFFGNGSLWYTENAEISYEISAKPGYSLENVILNDDNGIMEIKEVSGLYVVSPKGAATLTVNTVRTPVDIEIAEKENNKTVKVAENNTDVFAVARQSVEEISASIKEDVEIYNADGSKAESSAKIASGMQIVVKDKNGKEVDFKTVVVPGDVDGDADIKAADARLALRASVGLEKLSDWGGAAANVDGKDNIKASDARSILRAAVSLDNSADWLPTLS